MTQEQKYQVSKTYPQFEVRLYEPCVLADVRIDSPFQSAGNSAFGSLFGYISGGNKPNSKIAMTSPVLQESISKIAMTSPVLQESSGATNIVSFVMPAGMTMEQLPIPTNGRVTLRALPEQFVAVSRFSGRWTESAYKAQLASLEKRIEAQGLKECGPARFARFDPPWTPWFMRRNEIQIPIETPTQ
jgi:hypothetical protein